MHLLARWLPIVAWLPRYKPWYLRRDLVAGLTVGVMIIPQAIAYGLLAGVPPMVALAASIVPMAVYVLLGTSRELSVGPAALISLMTAQAIREVAPEAAEGSTLWVSLAILLALTVGAVQLGLGLVRLGLLVNFLSRPVVSGFMSAAALLIAASQLGLLLGVELEPAGFLRRVMEAAVAVPAAHGPTLLISGGCILVLALGRRLAPRVPTAFLVVLAVTALSWALDLPSRGVAVVGPVSGGWPVPSLPALPPWGVLVDLLPYAIPIALVGFLESISVAKTFAFQQRYDLDANQELVAVGAANLLGGLFGGYVVTGNISRTVVAAQSGARTQLAALVTAGLVLLATVWLSPLLAPLPEATLAAIVLVAIVGIVDLREPLRLLTFKRNDAAGLLATFAATLLLGVELGIVLGVAVSLALHLLHTSDPHVAVLGRLPDSAMYRDIRRWPEAREPEGVVVLRIDESLYFPNAPRLRDAVRQHHTAREQVPVGLVLDGRAVNDVDATAVAELEQIADELREAGTRLAIAGLSGPVMDTLRASGVMAHFGESNIYVGVEQAVRSFDDQVRAERARQARIDKATPPPVPR